MTMGFPEKHVQRGINDRTVFYSSVESCVSDDNIVGFNQIHAGNSFICAILGSLEPCQRWLSLITLHFALQMKDRVTKFEKFIADNEAKRRRAIQKYQTEVRTREQKTRELEEFTTELEFLKAK